MREAESDVLERQLGDELAVEMLVGGPDRANEDALAALGVGPAFPLVGVRPDGETQIGSFHLDFAWLDADAGVQGNDPCLIRKQRIDIELPDRRAVDHELRQPRECVGYRHKIGRASLAISF